jgi:hypothetical protein
VRLSSSCPEEESELRIGRYLRTRGKLISDSTAAEDIDIALDTCAEVDVVGIDFARQQGLKPYIKKYPQLLEMAGTLRSRACGAFWATWEMTDHRGIIRSHRRPFLAIERSASDYELRKEAVTSGSIIWILAASPSSGWTLRSVSRRG